MIRAGVAELADAPDLGSGTERYGSSSLFARTSRKYSSDKQRYAGVAQW